MGYHRPQQNNLRKDISSRLQSKLLKGESKYEAKRAGTMSQGIYSSDTFKTYSKACQSFASYVIDNNPTGVDISIEEARAFARGFIQTEIDSGKSPYTIAMERSALAKLYGVSGKDIHDNIPTRRCTEIKRSRERIVVSEKTGKEIKNPNSRAGHFSEKNNQEIVDFCKATGLRRSELAALRGTQLVGNRIRVKGKGGRVRNLKIIGDREAVVKRMLEAADGKVFDKVPAKMDVHHYRREYATAYYNQLARPIAEIPKEERYICRRDLKGIVYDKKALLEVSRSLGHSRVNVVAVHYIMR